MLPGVFQPLPGDALMGFWFVLIPPLGRNLGGGFCRAGEEGSEMGQLLLEGGQRGFSGVGVNCEIKGGWEKAMGNSSLTPLSGQMSHRVTLGEDGAERTGIIIIIYIAGCCKYKTFTWIPKF